MLPSRILAALALAAALLLTGCQWSTTWSNSHVATRLDILTTIRPTTTQPAPIPKP